ncbi:MAG: hypothetical protein OXI25_02445 [Chloroflexota bacterium]|nr:hypothetical protein [Chloroflexota bacterium]
MPGIGLLLGCIEFDPAREVVEATLQHRPRASQGARDALNAAIANSGIALDGFRKAANAPVAILTDAVCAEMVKDQNHRLASALFGVWKESQPKLAKAVSAHLEREGVPVLGAKREYFDALQPVAECSAEVERIVEEHADAQFSTDHTKLMLCYLSGRFPYDRPAVSGFLTEWLDRLDELPADAPEWEGIPAFAEKAAELAAEKRRSRSEDLAAALSGALEEINNNFAEELGFLEAAPLADSAGVAARLDLAPEGVRVLDELHAALAAFAEVRLPASTMSEERQRAEQRITRAEDAAPLAAEWQALAANADEANAAEAATQDEPPAKAEPSAELQRLEAENAEIGAEHDRLAADKAALEEENRRLQDDIEARQHAYDKLLTEKETQSEENGQLRSDLRDLRQQATLWYTTKWQQAVEEGGEPPPIDNVADAIEGARMMFPDTMVIELNSASRPDQAYRQPQEVYDALKWLATEYHYLRTHPLGKNPEWDLRLKEACNGWTYRGKQSDTAKGMFTKEYETMVNGKTYLLDAHIGNGTRGNPQWMIRIAFAWDPELEKVIVGYVGPHQKTQAS